MSCFFLFKSVTRNRHKRLVVAEYCMHPFSSYNHSVKGLSQMKVEILPQKLHKLLMKTKHERN